MIQHILRQFQIYVIYPAGGGIRLANGNSSCQGRVEVLYQDIWGTVCDDDWDFTNAQVVCRQVGCGSAIVATIQGFFGNGAGPILLDNVDCAGTENDLADCFNLGWGQHNCGHHEDAGVICRGEKHTQGYVFFVCIYWMHFICIKTKQIPRHLFVRQQGFYIRSWYKKPVCKTTSKKSH